MELYSDEMFEFQNLRLLFYQFLTFYHELLSICKMLDQIVYSSANRQISNSFDKIVQYIVQ